MKREMSDSSSFDLFLDTICNTFGGIVFLAILLAIMIQTRAIVKSPERSDQQPPTPDEVRELITKLDLLAAQHADLQQSLANSPARAELPEDAQFQELAAQLDQLTSELAEMTAMNASQTRQLAEVLAENSRLEEENRRVPAELQAVQNQVNQATAALRTTLADQQQTLQVPRVRDSNAASVLLLLQSQRVFLAMEPDAFGLGVNSRHVTTAGSLATELMITPLAGSGWPVATSDGWKRIEQLILEIRSKGKAVSIAVWPDSYEAFAEVKSRMVASGVGYQLVVMGEGETLVLRNGGGRSTIQ
ncbi:hypothetical protein [Candidatus Laterigemmans baculatus]|uniref:hypothetical protein n=1 Tax=Candidatus Laterigemmans baculatus TaxID=2770505 RepID=UPI0013DD15B8|nr:hypothetical protein [Candidatus Laterigemmans baculatus]